jgi:uncharacterized phage protein (TIGR01671 family)
MRSAKYRAWDGKRMLYMGPGGDCDFEIHGGSVFQWDSTGYEIHEKDYPLMQFTGLQDINGKDICEGDIVIDHVGKGEVEYVEKYAGFRVNYGDGQAKWFYHYNLKGERESIEVVGNIHEGVS